MKTTFLRTSLWFFLFSLLAAPSLLAQQNKLPQQPETRRQVTQALQMLKSQVAQHPEALQMRADQMRAATASKSADDSLGTGAIAGRIDGITDADSAWVLAIAAHLFEDPTAWQFGEVNPDGEFIIPGLKMGVYILMAGADDYMPQYFAHAYEVWGAVPVEVAPGDVMGGIDFFLEPNQSGAGSLTGQVFAEDTQEPVSRAQVYIFNVNNPFLSVWTETSDDGIYRLDNLRSGSYYVQVYTNGYFTQYYKGAATFEDATPVTITDGETTSGIDFLMSRGGTISGTVRDALGEPVKGANIQAYTRYEDPTGDPRGGYDEQYSYGWAQTDAEGNYTVTGLNTGDYVVLVQQYTHYYSVTEWYDDAKSEADATPVPVTLGEDTAGIDFIIDTPTEFGSVAGRIETEEGAPFNSALVRLESVNPSNFYYYNYTSPDEEGNYVIENVPTGDYRVVLEYWTTWYYDMIWYDQVDNPEDATIISVDADMMVTDINFVIPVADGVIAGVVTNNEGKPIANANIQLNNMDPGRYYEDGSINGAPVWAYATTDNEGRYRIEGLPDGEYFVSAFFCYFQECTQQWWPGVEYQERAEAVVLADGQSDPASVDFELPLELGNASLSGAITNMNGEVLAGAMVSIAPSTNYVDDRDSMNIGIDPNYGWVSELQVFTDENGNYSFNYLPAGTYYVSASYWEEGASGFAWYENALTVSDATPIELGPEEVRTDINLRLEVRSYLGSVAGTVTLEDGSPIERAYVEISSYYYRDYAPDIAFFPSEWYGLTDAAGYFQIDHLYEGEYMMAVYAQGAIRNAADSMNADIMHIKIAGGEVTMIDVSMIAQNEGAAEIGGVISSEQGDFFEVGIVKAIPVTDSGAPYYTAIADDNGVYRLTGLPEGEYYLQARAPWHLTEYYKETYDPAQAELVSTSANRPAEGIDFTLDPFYLFDFAAEDAAGGARPANNQTSTIYGNVTSDTGKPLVGATVYVVDQNGQALFSAETYEGGQYELAGIQPGLSYRVKATHAGYESQFNGAANDAASAPAFTMSNGRYEINFALSKSNTSVKNENGPELPSSLELLGNYPNPFNAETNISFSIPQAQHVTVEIFDALGRSIQKLQDGTLEAGTHNVRWSLSSGTQPSGLYFYRITTPTESTAGTMTRLQ